MVDQAPHGISFVVPAHNEEKTIASTVEQLFAALESVGLPFEIIVADDGSTDRTAEITVGTGKATIIRHPQNAGYGRAIKSGISASRYDWIGIVDSDGTYPIDRLPDLVKLMESGFDMAVGFRTNTAHTDNLFKMVFRPLLIAGLNIVLGASIKDPNSGFRLFRRELTEFFGPFLCNTFSFTTSLTIFAIGHGHFVGYVPINYAERTGHSKVRHFRDSLRMFQLILEGITFYNPMKFYIILVGMLFAFVALPAIIMLMFGWPLLALGYLFFGCTAALLGGLGMLGEINRIAAGLRTAETTPHALKLRAPR